MLLQKNGAPGAGGIGREPHDPREHRSSPTLGPGRRGQQGSAPIKSGGQEAEEKFRESNLVQLS